MEFEKKEFAYAGDLVKELVERLIPSENKDHYIFSVGWGEIVGAEMALHVFPRDIEKKTLILEVDHPGWHQKVLMKKGIILKKIQKKYSQLEIKRIKVFIGEGHHLT